MGISSRISKSRKVEGGLVRVCYTLVDRRITDLSITGDFFFYPEHELDSLTERLMGKQIREVEGIIMDFYRDHGIDSPGLEPGEIASLFRDHESRELASSPKNQAKITIGGGKHHVTEKH